MNTIKVRNVIIGKGRPKICVPIVAAAQEEILDTAAGFCHLAADLVEWRADWYEDVNDLSRVLETAGRLREILEIGRASCRERV